MRERTSEDERGRGEREYVRRKRDFKRTGRWGNGRKRDGEIENEMERKNRKKQRKREREKWKKKE